MVIIEIIFIAIGLSMDVSAVSIANGLTNKNNRVFHTFKIAGVFAIFHVLMPLIGGFMGGIFKDDIQAYDHWIALGLLSFVGINMIIEGLSKHQEEKKNLLKITTLLLTALAVSIDSLAIGISFSVLNFNILFVSLVIGGVTFILSSIFLYIGIRLEQYLGKKMEIIGGVILILIGLKITTEHIILNI